MGTKKNSLLSVSFILLAACLWGTAGVFVRSLEVILSEMQIVLWRALLSCVIIGVITLIKDINLFKIEIKDLPWFAASGIVSIVLFNFSYYKTMSLTSLSVSAVLLYTAPFFVILISVFAFKEKLTLQKLFACVCAFIGCCMVSGLFGSEHKISAEALFFGLLTGFGYAMYTVFGEILLKKGYSSLTITFYTFLCASIGCIPFVNVFETVSAAFSSLNLLLTVFGMALVNTVFPYILYTNGLKGAETSMAPIMATVEPVVATLVGTFLFKEPLDTVGFLGILLVLSAVVILNIKNNNTVSVKAFAKINLGLGILGKRENGYHDIDTVMQSVGIYDKLIIKKQKEILVNCDKCDIPQEENIAFKAAKLFFGETGIQGGAKISIKKGIPECAGLGGGSADAAAVLVALNKIYKAELTNERLILLAKKLGADVPFFIEGGTQRAQGIGEILTACEPLENCYILLVKHGKKSSTKEMYGKLDNGEYDVPNTPDLVSALKEKDYSRICDNVGNSFEKVSDQSGLKAELEALGADAAVLSGSGPTVFALFEDEQKARAAYKIAVTKYNECYLTVPKQTALKIE